MRSNFLSLILAGYSLTFGMVSSAYSLTAHERQIVQAAQNQIEIAIQDYNASKQALANAEQQVIVADKHAAQTDKAAAALQKEVDAAYAREKALATENTKMKPVYEECTKYWGLGAIFYGIKELIRHILIVAIVIVVLIIGIFILSFFFPLIGVIFSAVGRSLMALLGMLGSIFKRRPQYIPPSRPGNPLPPPYPVEQPVIVMVSSSSS